MRVMRTGFIATLVLAVTLTLGREPPDGELGASHLRAQTGEVLVRSQRWLDPLPASRRDRWSFTLPGRAS